MKCFGRSDDISGKSRKKKSYVIDVPSLTWVHTLLFNGNICGNNMMFIHCFILQYDC